MVVDRERESQLSLLARRGFVDPAAAGGLLGSASFGELGRDPVVLDALSRCADPDLALAALGRLLVASDDPQTLRATLASSKPLRDRLLGVLGVSAALGDFVVRHPESWHVLEEFEVEDLTPQPDRFRALMFEAVGAAGSDAASNADDGAAAGAVPLATLTGLAAEDALRVAYCRALLAITARDVAASADLSVVAADLAELAGATLEAALAVARAEDPASAALCRLAVIGMGKCGARELNYVSDVDVVFIAEPVRPDGADAAAVDDAEALRAATRLASRMMRLCSDSTAEGSIWQVDAGLRPEGKSGPLVRTLASHAAYYQRWAKTWEFQALLKARPVAGDAALGAAYIAMIGPMVWAAAGREHFVDDVQAMRRRVVDHATDSLRRAPGSVAVDRELKLGPGGLRDVEFAVQLLQLVHGRRDETLRMQGTMEALGALAEGGYVGREDAAHLADAYRFLRTLEHRIQLFRLERTHTMPDNPAALRRIGRSMGWAIDPAGELGKAWRAHAREVRRLHEKLFYRPLLVAVARLDESSAATVPSGTGPSPRLSAQEARARLAALGYADPAGALANIEALATGVSRRAAIQRTLLPVMLGWFADAPDPDAGLLAFRRVSDALGSTPWYLRTLRDEGEAAWRLARILSCGGYVPDLLLRDPAAVSLLGQRD
ncbi:MAG TPA: bifunctional [glutamine synthetase] adenylyltransferase/[glutamine synthetase]-adenylyl-L-tyrosine phosphorylase, partial [Actinocrinis sp.]|nr:bifunctional [glutamine synthetase] adenylyltransferase/[glutamine synthetase]-adenylyl-L-tyrosine phosphorylase [Actinocrinis sp.]